jgi:predicted TIM-barrel fold metal-dependent hydrolase
LNPSIQPTLWDSVKIAVRRSAHRKSLWENEKMTDEIIQEVWRAKDRLAKEFHYDMDALAAELQRRQKQSGRKVVNLAKTMAGQTAKRPQ